MEAVLDIAIIVFIFMELSNVIIMYFKPDFKYGNSMTVFRNWWDSRKDDNMRSFVNYLVNRVANCKLIFFDAACRNRHFRYRTVKGYSHCGSYIINRNILCFALPDNIET